MSGLELSYKLREIRPDLPIILTSGFSEKLTPESLADANIDGFLKKSFSTSDLSKTIREVLDKKKVS